MRVSHDVAVVGAGPVGSVAAIALARQGAKVLLVEANPKAARRFAGEWIHPPGVEVLERLGVGRLDGAETRTGFGFTVFPDDGSEPIRLPYQSGATALSCEHSEMVRVLREHAVGFPEISYLPQARVTGIDGHHLHVDAGKAGRRLALRAERIVVATGRSPLPLAMSALPESRRLSYMASVELRDVRLPAEGYGHVMLGGPGAVLMYRIGADRVRACLDLPQHARVASRSPAALWDAFHAVLPAALVPRFRAALEEGPIQWAATRFRPRAAYATGQVALIGDAAGHVHPLTAVGLTQGFLDAERLAQSSSLRAYATHRERETYMPELLACALYQVFSREDYGASAIRRAIYDTWRHDPDERERTMRLLMADAQAPRGFGMAFAQISLRALRESLTDAAGARAKLRDALLEYREWLQWPAASLLPGELRRRARRGSDGRHPVPGLAHLYGAVARVTGNTGRTGTPRSTRTPEADRLHVTLGSVCERLATELASARSVPLDAHASLAESLSTLHADTQLAGAACDRAWQRLATLEVPPVSQGDALALGLLARCNLPSSDAQRPELATQAAALVHGQRLDGGFAPAPGMPSTTEATARALQALARVRPRMTNDAGLAVSKAMAAARGWLSRAQAHDGSWPEAAQVSATSLASLALLEAGMWPGDAVLRRARAWLCRRLDASGLWDDSGSSPYVTSARALHALVAAREPDWAVLERGAATLCAALERLADLPDFDANASGNWLQLCEPALALARYAQLEARRLQPRQPAAPASNVSQVYPTRARMVRGAAAPPPHRGRRVGELADDDWSFCKQALAAVSRTFSRPIGMLPDQLEVSVTCGYLLCRIADTIEDHPLFEVHERDTLFDLLLGVLAQRRAPEELATRFHEVRGDDPELVLARQLPTVMRAAASLPEPMQQTCARWVSEMIRGMSLYTHREPAADGVAALSTLEDLQRYCYYVAGTVGHMLTELFVARLGHKLDRAQIASLNLHAEHFGMGLQLVNILKDITDDWQRGVCYIPRTLCEQQGITVRELIEPRYRAQAHAAVAPVFEVASRSLHDAFSYTLALPHDEPGVRLFCLLPLWMAVRTLVLARGHDGMFSAEHSVKISRSEVEGLIADCTRTYADDDALIRSFEALWRPSQPHQPQAALRASAGG